MTDKASRPPEPTRMKMYLKNRARNDTVPFSFSFHLARQHFADIFKPIR
jgi:hypothetical protein